MYRVFEETITDKKAQTLIIDNSNHGNFLSVSFHGTCNVGSFGAFGADGEYADAVPIPGLIMAASDSINAIPMFLYEDDGSPLIPFRGTLQVNTNGPEGNQMWTTIILLGVEAFDLITLDIPSSSYSRKVKVTLGIE